MSIMMARVRAESFSGTCLGWPRLSVLCASRLVAAQCGHVSYQDE
jgi:hypothetical protein